MTEQPNEILVKIAGYLALKEYRALSLSCYQLYYALKNPTLVYRVWANQYTQAELTPNRENCQTCQDFYRIIISLYNEPKQYMTLSGRSDLYVNLILKTPLLVERVAFYSPTRFFGYVCQYPQFSDLLFGNSKLIELLRYVDKGWEAQYLYHALRSESTLRAFLANAEMIQAVTVRSCSRHYFPSLVQSVAGLLFKRVPEIYFDQINALLRAKDSPRSGLLGWILYDLLMDLRKEYLGLEPIPYELGSFEQKVTRSAAHLLTSMPIKSRAHTRSLQDAELDDEQAYVRENELSVWSESLQLTRTNTRIPTMFRFHDFAEAVRLCPEKFTPVQERVKLITIPKHALEPPFERKF